ncbi:TetR/AcrR family transcriptional regulator [bacterium]|nr:TetR/AcrR family transcriptional regulator [bacterium]
MKGNKIEKDSPMALKKKNKRERLINAAIKLLSEKGYANTKIKDIASEAKVADGTVYSYFSSKEDLMMKALTESLHNKLIEVKQITSQETDVRTKILKFFDIHAIVFTQNPHIAKFLIEDIRQIKEYYDKYPSFSIFDEYREYMKEIFNEGIQKGMFRNVSAEAFGLTVIGAMDFVLTQWVLKKQNFDLRNMVLKIIDLIHYGSGKENE